MPSTFSTLSKKDLLTIADLKQTPYVPFHERKTIIKPTKPFRCVLCYDTPQCLRCENTQLKTEKQILQNELTKLYSIIPECLTLAYYDKLNITKHFIQSKLPMQFEYKSKLTSSWFFTITFDPSKFGLQPFEDERKDYILHSLYKMIPTQYYHEIYGSFEYTKSGLIHAHFIIITMFPNEVESFLKPFYSDSKNNKIAVHKGPAKYPAAEEYIIKESTHYFYINADPIIASIELHYAKQKYMNA